jgi:diaminopimelate decarboxylase
VRPGSLELNLTRTGIAFHSACQAVNSKEASDALNQAVHLAASMLFCGLKSVIGAGTMW